MEKIILGDVGYQVHPPSLVLNLSLAVAAEDKSQTVDARVVKLTFLRL